MTGVQYSVSINGGGYTDYAAGNYEAADGDLVVVEAHPMPGYAITGTDSWSHTFTDVGECELPTLGLAVPTISSTPITCSAAGSYTVGGGINGEHVVWTLEGSATPIPCGTYAVTSRATHNGSAVSASTSFVLN